MCSKLFRKKEWSCYTKFLKAAPKPRRTWCWILWIFHKLLRWLPSALYHWGTFEKSCCPPFRGTGRANLDCDSERMNLGRRVEFVKLCSPGHLHNLPFLVAVELGDQDQVDVSKPTSFLSTYRILNIGGLQTMASPQRTPEKQHPKFIPRNGIFCGDKVRICTWCSEG